MTRFASHISTLLYAVLLAILAFVTAVILAAVGTLIVDAISPGALGTVHINAQALDVKTPGVVAAALAVMLMALGLAWAALLPLIQMLRSTAAGAPFTIANVKRLNWIAGTIAAAPRSWKRPIAARLTSAPSPSA